MKRNERYGSALRLLLGSVIPQRKKMLILTAPSKEEIETMDRQKKRSVRANDERQ